MLLDEKGREFAALEIYPYPPVPPCKRPAWDGLPVIGAGNDNTRQVDPDAYPGIRESALPAPADLQQRIAEECARSYEAGRSRGFEEGSAAAQKKACEQSFQEASAQAVALQERLAQVQKRYFESLEPQLVRLALDIAARVLRREVRVDPLLLTGAVRVAIGQIAASSHVRLIVPKEDLALWTESMEIMPNLPVRPAVVPDAELMPGECRIESDLGSADLSLKAQLEEIESALFDGPQTGASSTASELEGRSVEQGT